MTDINWPPFILFYLAALIIPFAGKHLRSAVLLATPLLGLLLLYFQSGELLQDNAGLQLILLGQPLSLYRVDKLSLLFSYIFHIAAFIFAFFSLHLNDKSQHCTAMIYVGSAIGAIFSGDLISLFIFWEIIAISSTYLVMASRTEAAISSGIRYLIIQLLSGVLLLIGTLLFINETGSSVFSAMALFAVEHPHSPQISAWLILVAFGIKCGFPPFHNALTDAYPQSTATGTVYISAFTTIVAVYTLARAFAGADLLIYVGAAMAIFPIFYAVIENDLRRVLSYSTINQLGFMVCGIGIGTELAVNGAVAHAVNNVVFKSLLMMAMGAVLYRVGTVKGSELGGLYKTMPYTTVFCIIGAAAISAFPLFSGFVSKAMILSAVLAEQQTIIWLILLFASAGVFHHAGIKIPFFAFFGHDSGIRTQDPPKSMLVAMALAAAMCIGIGIFPQTFYELLPFSMEYKPYTSHHVLTQLQLLFFSALAFVWLKRLGIYPPELVSSNIDVEWLYRRLAPKLWLQIQQGLHRAETSVQSMAMKASAELIDATRSAATENGWLTGKWKTSSMVMLMVVLFGGLLIYNYL
ncbi:Na(+)/H(+) antiporter subunit D [Dasania marina]|uniref:Na(+)/H(+) antiporter subunit D n=1 Tax=Dasania marina TaxID=471499 RepID=UPI000376D22D|nr:Na(+)/H(+) antiporter subunit D [Dasania marina]